MTLVKRPRHTELEPVQVAPPGALDGYVVLEQDEWLDARPPANSAIGEHWANLVTPARHMARGFLWLTYTWVRAAVAVSLLLALLAILMIRIGA